MYIAMNRFKIVPGAEADFERLWTSRDTHLKDVPGFVEFHLLKGPAKDDHVLYSSHDLGESGGVRRLDAVRRLSRRASQRRRRDAPALSRAPRIRRLRSHSDRQVARFFYTLMKECA